MSLCLNWVLLGKVFLTADIDQTGFLPRDDVAALGETGVRVWVSIRLKHSYPQALAP